MIFFRKDDVVKTEKHSILLFRLVYAGTSRNSEFRFRIPDEVEKPFFVFRGRNGYFWFEQASPNLFGFMTRSIAAQLYLLQFSRSLDLSKSS
jgi:hypothetical protein